MNEAVTWTLEVADQASPALKSAAAASQQLTDTVAKTDAQLGKLDVVAGKVGSNAMKLAGGLDLIAPGAGAAARGLGDLADVAEVGAGALGLSATALGVLGVALTVGAGLWYAYTDAQADAVAQAEAQEAATRAQIQAINDLALAQRDAELVIAQESGSLSPGQAFAQAQIARYREGVEGQAEQLRRDIAAAQDNLSTLSARGALTPESLADADADLAAARNAYAEFNRTVDDTIARLGLAGEKRDEEAAAAVREAAATKAAAEAAREAAKAQRERDQAEKELLRAVEDFAAAWDGVEESVAAASQDMAALGPALSAEIAEAARAREEAARAEMMAQAQQATGYATGGPSAVLSGIGNAGPVGAIIAAVVQIVGNLDELGDTFSDFTIDFNQSIAELPSTLGDNLDRWLTDGTQSAIDLVPDLLSNVASGLPDILEGALGSLGEMVGEAITMVVAELPTVATDLILSLTDPEMWLDVGIAIVEGFISGIGGIFDTADSGGSKVSSSAEAWVTTDKFAGGTTYVPTDGVYQLHRGEVVSSAARMRTDRAQQQAGRARLSATAGRWTFELEAGEVFDALDLSTRRGYSFGGG